MPTFYDRFRECSDRWPANPCLEIQRRDRMESYTYAQVRQMAESFARWLSASFQPGARIAILAENHPRWVASYLGIIAAGCTAVPLDSAFHADQIAKLLEDSGSSLLLSDLKHLPAATQAAAGFGIPTIVLNPEPGRPTTAGLPDLDAIFAAGPGDFSPLPASSDSLASLLYTSGTTAEPKGVMLTHGNLLGEVAAVCSVIHLGPQDSILGLLPLFHVLSQMANLLLPLVSGSRVVYLETLNTTELLRALQEREITIFCVVPQFFYLIYERIFKEAARRGALAELFLRRLMALNRTLRKLGINAGGVFFGKIHHLFGPKMRHLITGGSRFSPEIAQDFHSLGIDILQAYGLTETTAEPS